MEQTTPPKRIDKLSEDRIKGSFGIGIGMLMAISWQWLSLAHMPRVVTVPLIMLATLVFTTGCIFYTKSKGFAPWLGLLGVLWIPGLVVLILLPDRKDTTLKDLQTVFVERRKQRDDKNAPGTKRPGSFS